MNEEIHECYIEAGKIAAQIREEAVSRIKEGILLIEIAEYVENRTKELGARPAFPCNISINEVASHYTPEDDMAIFKKGDVVKVDLGVHIEGFIADTASTVEIGTRNHSRLILASKEALSNAITSVRDGVHTRMIGKVIEKTIKKYGFNPVKDLTGHSMERYKLHAGMTIPNYGTFFSQKIKKDMVFAIEPFVTYGKGFIKYGKTHIFAVSGRVKTKANLEIRELYGDLPFALRWIPQIRVEDLKGLKEFREMIEADQEIVAQSEHTVVVNEEGCQIITR